jgi:hypothetical protein
VPTSNAPVKRKSVGDMAKMFDQQGTLRNYFDDLIFF